jgi:hypothetical protein
MTKLILESEPVSDLASVVTGYLDNLYPFRWQPAAMTGARPSAA